MGVVKADAQFLNSINLIWLIAVKAIYLPRLEECIIGYNKFSSTPLKQRKNRTGHETLLTGAGYPCTADWRL